MIKSNATSSWNADLIDEMHSKWIESPDSLDPTWKAFFEGFELGSSIEQKEPHSEQEEASSPLSKLEATKQARFIGLIYAYRSLGHTIANFNPLSIEANSNPRLTLERLGFKTSDLEGVYDSGNYMGGIQLSLKELIDRLEKTYCKTVGFEYLHIQETSKRRWIQARIEPECFEPRFSREQKQNILKNIIEAETFEEFLQSKFLGQKRFSLEGAETLIAILDSIFQRCEKNKVDEIVMGMAHRGRLNVLGNFLGKSFEYILREFSENYIPDTIYGDGDVKYHLGFETKRKTTEGHPVELRLAANPSHLEAVDPVVQGKARARQRIREDLERKKVLPILIHGDAAIAGQGIVSEVFNFSQLKGYRTGGTIHIVVNNQIGFTTGPEDARSSRYCTDVAKIVEAPIFHVNCNDPLAVVAAVETAFDYRQTFGSDVVIDMYCYRKHGHNESDEPAFTQPVLYQKISNMSKISQILAEQLKAQGDVTEEEVESIKKNYLDILETAHNKNLENSTTTKDPFAESNARKQPPYSFEVFETKVNQEILGHIVNQHAKFPEGFRVNRKIKRQLEAKIKAFETDSGIDWGLAESLAFGSLLIEGTPVRISGQDSKRGTFSHRHSVLYDTETRERYTNLLDLSDNQAQFCVHNSLLSEAAVLGFDFGYSLDFPKMLCIWEAQFGDFVNGAQVIIDQFITSSESKWGRLSGIVMLLPHGYEGQGPEHSSARLERFLQSCADNNIQVCNLTTPAQLFHVLRRQMKREFKKPLVIMTPKSLLRHKECVSKVADFTDGHFQNIIDDHSVDKNRIKKIILCSGKVYYDLESYRKIRGYEHIAIIRVEQFYPLDRELFSSILKSYPDEAEITWCQEEPKNMGGWTFIFPYILEFTGKIPKYVGRKSSASPAVGSLAIHKYEQSIIVSEALDSK
ncbi:MAG: 2-oxoglutarate dehydrogenase E1 component [Coraliomargaritaceae bacterium]